MNDDGDEDREEKKEVKDEVRKMRKRSEREDMSGEIVESVKNEKLIEAGRGISEESNCENKTDEASSDELNELKTEEDAKSFEKKRSSGELDSGVKVEKVEKITSSSVKERNEIERKGSNLKTKNVKTTIEGFKEDKECLKIENRMFKVVDRSGVIESVSEECSEDNMTPEELSLKREKGSIRSRKIFKGSAAKKMENKLKRLKVEVEDRDKRKILQGGLVGVEDERYSIQDFDEVMKKCNRSAFPSYVLYAFEVARFSFDFFYFSNFHQSVAFFLKFKFLSYNFVENPDQNIDSAGVISNKKSLQVLRDIGYLSGVAIDTIRRKKEENLESKVGENQLIVVKMV